MFDFCFVWFLPTYINPFPPRPITVFVNCSGLSLRTCASEIVIIIIIISALTNKHSDEGVQGVEEVSADALAILRVQLLPALLQLSQSWDVDARQQALHRRQKATPIGRLSRGVQDGEVDLLKIINTSASITA